MKNYILIIGITSLFSLFVSACSKDKSPAPGTPGNPSTGQKPYIKMKVGGRDWYDETVAVSGISMFDGSYNASIAGTDENFEDGKSGLSIIFSSTSDFTAGTYDVEANDGGVALTKVNGKTYMSSSTGAPFNVTITSIQSSGSVRKMKGTFSGTLVGPTPGDVITISDGEFSGY